MLSSVEFNQLTSLQYELKVLDILVTDERNKLNKDDFEDYLTQTLTEDGLKELKATQKYIKNRVEHLKKRDNY